MFTSHLIRRGLSAALGTATILTLTVGGAFAADTPRPPQAPPTPPSQPAPTPPSEPRPELRGLLGAEGRGSASFNGTGAVTINGKAGEVTIKGATNIRAEGRGKREKLQDGTVRFTGWQGRIVAIGKDMTVSAKGERVNMRAEGKGSATLKGKGVYRTKTAKGEWSADGVTVEVKP